MQKLLPTLSKYQSDVEREKCALAWRKSRSMRVFQQALKMCLPAGKGSVACPDDLASAVRMAELRVVWRAQAMLGPQVIVKYDSQLRPTHLYVQSRYSADFQEVMRENSITVELVHDDRNRECFRLVDLSQAEAAEAACALWQELGYFRHREQLTVSPA
jgi:hypothetical protein